MGLESVAAALDRAARDLYGKDAPVDVTFEVPRNRDFGDFATNVAFKLAKTARKAPQAIATEIAARAMDAGDGLRANVADVQPVGGFINVRMQPSFWQAIVAQILRDGLDYGRGAPTGKRLSLEFGSANPTGPMLVVQGRALAIGSTLTNALRFLGNEVVTDWYINDAGSQLDTLVKSLHARWRQLREPDFPFPEDGYPAPYVVELAKDLDALQPREPENPQWLEAFARERMVEAQRATARRFGVDFIFQSERVLHRAGLVDAIIDLLEAEGLTVSDGDAIALSAELDPDEDKARILRRSDGRPTYFAADIPYHFAKFRHADHLIDILGPDHHGYIARVRAMAAIWRRLYGKPEFAQLLKRIDALELEGPTHWAGRDVAIEVLIAQQVSLVRGGEVASMSKRAGNIIELDEILDEVGVDAARFFFIMLAPESPLTFDLELAVKQSTENPVYYVQYGHARIASLIAHARGNPETAHYVDEAARGAHLDRLVHPLEIALVRRLAEWPKLVAQSAKLLAPHLLTSYAREVAADFHQFYTACTVVDRTAPETSVARLGLSLAAKSVLANTLAICGVSAPDFMERR